MGSGRWRPWVSLKQKAIKPFSISLLFSWPFPHLCNAKPYVCFSMLQSLFSTVCLNIRLNLVCFQSRPPQLQVNSSQTAFWNLPSQCYMGRLRSLHRHFSNRLHLFLLFFFLTLGKEFFCANRVGDPRTSLFPVRVKRALCLPGVQDMMKIFLLWEENRKGKRLINCKSSPMSMISKWFFLYHNFLIQLNECSANRM